MSNTLIPLAIVLLLIISCSDKNQSTLVKTYWGNKVHKKDLKAFLLEKREQYDIPGLAFGLINEGKLVQFETLGYADQEKEVEVTHNTIFEAASLSKPVFAYFTMQFIDDGLLSLDTPLHTYLEYPDIAHDERYKKITARMVLSHRSGFPNWRDEDGGQLKIHFDPGTDYRYSGEGYMYLSLVLKHLLKTDWYGLEQEFQKRIAKPFNMAHSRFLQDDYIKQHKANPYDRHGDRIDLLSEDSIISAYRKSFRAPASLHSNVEDFSKWMIALMNNEELSDSGFDELFKNHSLIENESNAFFNTHYTLGFFHPAIPGTNIYIHGGNNRGFTCWFTLDPEKKWGYVIFTNSEYGEFLGRDLLYFLLINKARALSTILVTLLLLVILLIIRKRCLIKRKLKNTLI